MTHILFTGAQMFSSFTASEKAIIEILPFLGLGVVIVGLTILALVLTQFKRLGGENERGHGHGKKKTAKAVSAVQPEPQIQSSFESEEGELVAVAAAIGLYLEESAEVVNLTEVERDFNQSPWTAFGIQMQQYRFQRWQSTR